jgi:Ras-related protein Rab-2A
MTSSYFGGANAVIIVFDVARAESFASVPKWISEAKRFSEKCVSLLTEVYLFAFSVFNEFAVLTCRQKDIAFFIVGNKTDLSDRQVTKDEAEKFALQNSAIYFEVRYDFLIFT